MDQETKSRWKQVSVSWDKNQTIQNVMYREIEKDKKLKKEIKVVSGKI